MTDPVPPAASQPGIRRVLIGAVAFVAIFGLIATQWTRGVGEIPDEDVGVQWNSAIKRLGIDPIYPPQEDVSVGDVMLVVASDRSDPDALPQFDAANSLKLWRLDLSEDLKRYYAYVPNFPDTEAQPQSAHDIWKQQDASDSVFNTAIVRKNLPIVMFPEFSLARIRQSSHGFSGGGSVLSGLSGLFGGSSSGERTIELRVPAAETYGVPSIVANARLSDFCNDAKTKSFCSNAVARRHLATLAGSAMFECMPPRKGETKRAYRYEVQIVVISRVYLTRSIETLVSSGSGAVERAALGPSAGSGSNAETPDNKPDSAGGTSAANSLSQEERDKLSQLADRASGITPGSSVSIGTADAQRITITKTLQRPVAIGYRAFRADLSKEDAACSDAP